MSAVVAVLGFGNYVFAADDFHTSIPADAYRDTWRNVANVHERAGALALVTATSIGERRIAVEFTFPEDVDLAEAGDRLLGKLDPTDPRARKLVGETWDGRRVWRWAVIEDPHVAPPDGTINGFRVVFLSSDPVWRAEDEETTGAKAIAGASDTALTLEVGGSAPVYPRMYLKGTGLKTATTAAKGWKYRKLITMENVGERTIDRYPYRLDLGDTAALVSSGKMMSNGDDLFIVDPQGRVLPRTLDDINTASTGAWIIVDGLLAGETREYAMVYGNASAGVQAALVYPDEPPFDLNTSSNVTKAWQVAPTAANAGAGAWHLDRGTQQPGIVDRSVPGAWQGFAYLPNDDDYGLSPWVAYTDAGAKWNAGVYLTRGAQDALLALTDRRVHDGIAQYNPLGFTRLDVSWSFRNPDGLGRLLVVVRYGDASSWTIAHEDASTHATLTAQGLTTLTWTSPYPTWVGIVLVPTNYAYIPRDQPAGNFAEAYIDATLEARADTAMLTTTVPGSEEQIFDFAGQIYLNATELPYDALALGGFGDTDRLFIPLQEYLIYDPEEGTLEHWDTTLENRLAYLNTGATVFGITEADGTLVNDRLSPDPLRLPPAGQTVTNADFETDFSSWAREFNRASTNTDYVRTTTGPLDGVGSGQGSVTSNGVAPNQTISNCMNQVKLDIVPGRNHRLSADLWTNHISLQPYLIIEWRDAADVLLFSSEEPAPSIPASTEVRRVWEAGAPDDAAYCRVGVGVYSKATAALGAIKFDRVRFDHNEITWDAWDGPVTIEARWTEGVM